MLDQHRATSYFSYFDGSNFVVVVVFFLITSLVPDKKCKSGQETQFRKFGRDSKMVHIRISLGITFWWADWVTVEIHEHNLVASIFFRSYSVWQFKWKKNAALWFKCKFTIDLGGRGFCFTFYSDQDWSCRGMLLF